MTKTESKLSKIDRLISGKPALPERIYGWLDTQMSIARFYGGLTYRGHSYLIAPHEPCAPLVRVDVLEREQKSARAKRKAVKLAVVAAQGDLL